MSRLDEICLGTAKLGIPDYGFSSTESLKNFDPIAFLKGAESIGIRRFDTSPRYGKSEEILGQYISESMRPPFVSSKIDALVPHAANTTIRILESVQRSLSKLHLKRLDICYLHQNELEIISDPRVHEGLMLLKLKNLVRDIGVSLYSFQECEYALEAELFDVMQIPVSVFDLNFYNRFAKNNNSPVRFAARSLLLQGILTNRRLIPSRIKQWRQVLTYMKELDQVAEEYSLSTLEMSLAFVFSLHKIDHYVIGTRSISNLQRDVRCLNKRLPSDAFSRISEMASKAKEWTNPRNWR